MNSFVTGTAYGTVDCDVGSCGTMEWRVRVVYTFSFSAIGKIEWWFNLV